ncbi:TPA: hypothetical protein MFG77_001822 [Klebsiella pneumoniae]|nr:Uncharacterised protein [Klebsiella pneumoniae]HBW8033289.1 hypothetical protein [Klebsiella pneumoniae]
MTKSTITRERLAKIKSWRETYGAGSNVMLPAEEAEELARIALAAMDSEPVAEVVSIYGDPEAFGEREIRPLVGIQQMPYGTKLYRHAQQPVVESEPVAFQPELAKVIYHFRDWNEGFPVERFKADYVISWMLANYPPAPPAPVVSADLLHTAASAIEDLLTTKDRTGACVWFDLPFRLRSAANAQPATVVPEEKPIPNTLSMYAVDAVAAIAEVKGWNACRAAMLERQLVDRVDEKSLTSINPAPDLVSLQKKAESIIGNYPGIPDGYVMVPVEPNGDMLAAAQDAYGETDGDIASTLRAAMLSGGKS